MIVKLLLLRQSMLLTFCSLTVRSLSTKSTQTDISRYRPRITTAMTVFPSCSQALQLKRTSVLLVVRQTIPFQDISCLLIIEICTVVEEKREERDDHNHAHYRIPNFGICIGFANRQADVGTCLACNTDMCLRCQNLLTKSCTFRTKLTKKQSNRLPPKAA